MKHPKDAVYLERSRSWACWPALLLLLVVGGGPVTLTAEDSDEVRPYFTLRRGEFNYKWGPQDMWGLGVGVNLNRYLGVEVALDTWEESLRDPVLNTVGEEAATSIIPQVRLRYPLFRDRLVPYAVAGIGGGFYQFNDRKPNGFDHYIDADGGGWAASAGAGIEYFIADNIALGLEFKYIWHQSLEVIVDDRTFDYDPSNWIATIGFRVFLQQNQPRAFAEASHKVPIRLYLGARAGVAVLTDSHWGPGVTWKPEASGWADTFNHHFGATIGANFGRYWGVELGIDGGEYTVVADGIGGLGEYSVTGVIPQVRLRLPVNEGRWVPYMMTGVGVSYGEANDVKGASEGVTFEANGIYPAFTVGGGVELFIARNISLSAETRWFYTWGNEYTLNDQTQRGDFSHLQFLLGVRLYLVEF